MSKLFSTKFLSTPSARRATDYRLVRLAKFDISIHALREEGDAVAVCRQLLTERFLSTPSARRAMVGGAGRKPSKDISIHALREEGDDYVRARACQCKIISIHALREEGDCGCC